jgi:hypothetical protein
MPTATRPEVQEGYFPHWKLNRTGVIMPEERLPWGQTIVSGLQHGVAMAGGTAAALAAPMPRPPKHPGMVAKLMDAPALARNVRLIHTLHSIKISDG